MTYTEALPYVSSLLDDALAVKPFDPANVPPGAVLVGWQCGFEPMFVAVHSYLPNVTLDAEDAEEIAMDYLDEKNWFAGESRHADHILRAPTQTPQPEQEQQEAAPTEDHEPLCPKCNQHLRMTGFWLCQSCQQFEDADA